MVSAGMPATGASECFRLLYRSHSRIPHEERTAALGEIFGIARSQNKRAGITGALLLTDNYFVQALEGEEEVVRDLFARISQDPRHEDVTVIETEVGERVFARWAMAEVSKSGGADIPLISHGEQGGIAPAAPRQPTTREQDAVLRAMRNTIGADTV